jgi:hypothetical protein
MKYSIYFLMTVFCVIQLPEVMAGDSDDDTGKDNKASLALTIIGGTFILVSALYCIALSIMVYCCNYDPSSKRDDGYDSRIDGLNSSTIISEDHLDYNTFDGMDHIV